MRFRLNILCLLLFTFLLVTTAGAATDSATCLSCHGSMEGAVNVNKDKY